MDTARPILYRGYDELLPSLRGIAATIVLTIHVMLVFPIDGRDNFSYIVPDLSMTAGQFIGQLIVMLFNGSGAVTFFFVHSGFVLSLSLSRVQPHPKFLGRIINYFAFAIRRFFRLLPLITSTTLVGFIYQKYVMPHPTPPQVSQWFTLLFADTTGLQNLWENLLLIRHNINPFLWTVQIEIFGSLLLPLFVWSTRWALTSFIAFFLFFVFASPNFPHDNDLIIFMMCFFVGAQLGTLTQDVTAVARTITNSCASFAAAYEGTSLHRPVSVLCRTLSNANFYVLVSFLVLLLARPFLPNFMLATMVETLAAAPIIYLVYYVDEGPLQRFCALPLMRFLGRISYSFYGLSALFIHVFCSMLVMLVPTSFGQEHGLLMGLFALPVIFGLCCFFGQFTFRFIEMPFKALGQRISKAIRTYASQLGHPAIANETAGAIK